MLLDAYYTACLADFGYASLVGNIPEALTYLKRFTTRPGALRWIAPEQVDPEETFNRTTKSDIYSFGCVALQGSLLDSDGRPMLISLQVLSGQEPWSEVGEDSTVVLRLAKGHKPGRPESRTLNDSHWSLIQYCWSPIEERPAAEAIIPTIQQFLSSCPWSRPPSQAPTEDSSTSFSPLHPLHPATSTSVKSIMFTSNSQVKEEELKLKEEETRLEEEREKAEKQKEEKERVEWEAEEQWKQEALRREEAKLGAEDGPKDNNQGIKKRKKKKKKRAEQAQDVVDSNSSAPSPNSQSPTLSHASPQITASHSRRPSALGQGVPIKEGVSVPRNNVGSVRQGTSSSTPLPLLVSILIPHPRFCRHFRFHRRSVSSLVIFTCSHPRG